MNYFVKTGYLLLKNKTNPNILKLAKNKLYNLNIEMYKRRRGHLETIK